VSIFVYLSFVVWARLYWRRACVERSRRRQSASLAVKEKGRKRANCRKEGNPFSPFVMCSIALSSSFSSTCSHCSLIYLSCRRPPNRRPGLERVASPRLACPALPCPALPSPVPCPLLRRLLTPPSPSGCISTAIRHSSALGPLFFPPFLPFSSFLAPLCPSLPPSLSSVESSVVGRICCSAPRAPVYSTLYSFSLSLP
jgi:hypothetical protein